MKKGLTDKGKRNKIVYVTISYMNKKYTYVREGLGNANKKNGKNENAAET